MDYEQRVLRRRSLILIAILSPFAIAFMAVGAFCWVTLTGVYSLPMVATISTLRTDIASSAIPLKQVAVIDQELAELESDARWLRVSTETVERLVNAVEADTTTLYEVAEIENLGSSLIAKSNMTPKEKQQGEVIVRRLAAGMHDNSLSYYEVLQTTQSVRQANTYSFILKPAPTDQEIRQFLYKANALVNEKRIELDPEPIRYDKTICYTIFLARNDRLPDKYDDAYGDW